MGQVSSRDPLPLFPRSAVPPPRPSSNLIPRSFQKLQGGQPPGLAGRRAGTPAGLARRCHMAWHPGVPSEMERWHPDVVRAPGCVCVGGVTHSSPAASGGLGDIFDLVFCKFHGNGSLQSPSFFRHSSFHLSSASHSLVLWHFEHLGHPQPHVLCTVWPA